MLLPLFALKDTDGLTYSESEKKANILNCQFPQFSPAVRILKPFQMKSRVHTHAWTIFILLKMVS